MTDQAITRHERRILGHASGWQELMDTCVCGNEWPCRDIQGPPYTVDRYGSLGAAVNAEIDWLKRECEQLRADAKSVAVMLLDNDKSGVMDWARGIVMSLGKPGEIDRLKTDEIPIEILHGSRKVSIYEDEIMRCPGTSPNDQMWGDRSAELIQKAIDWLYESTSCDAGTSASTANDILESIDRCMCVREIRERHNRISKLLRGPGSFPGTVLGPMDAETAHYDRSTLLSLLTPER